MVGMPASGSARRGHRISGWRIDFQPELHGGTAIVRPRKQNMPVRAAYHGRARVGHGGQDHNSRKGGQEFTLGREAPVAVLHDRYRLDVGCGDRLRDAGKRDPRARLFVQE
jgi:hypothetical protein